MVPTQWPALSNTGSARWLWIPTHKEGPLSTIAVEDTHKGSSRLGLKKTVWFGQGFTTCMKRTNLAGTCTPCNSAASTTLALSKVELVVAVCDAVLVEKLAEVAVEVESSCACNVCIGCGMAVQLAASISTHKGTIKSIPIRVGVPANPIITTKGAWPIAEPHFSHRYHVCPAIGKVLPLAPLMTCSTGAMPPTWPCITTRLSV